jgi:hypothetical protein
MFNIFHWIGKFIDFFGDKTRTSIGIFILFCFYIFFHLLVLWKKTEFKTAIQRLLRIFGTILIIYIVYSLVLILKKDFFLSSMEIDAFLFPILCGFLLLLILLMFNKIQIFVPNKYFILIGIPICVFGVMISFIVFYGVPLTIIHYGGHAPWELIAIILLILIILSLFIGIKNFIKKIKEKK